MISEQSNIREHFKNNNIYLVAWVDNQILGKLVFTTSDSNHGKMEIYIRQEFRRQGIGNELIKYLLTWSKKTKLKEIKLEVLEDNKPAINLYKKFGWQTENKDGKIYKIKEKNINSLIMTKLL